MCDARVPLHELGIAAEAHGHCEAVPTWHRLHDLRQDAPCAPRSEGSPVADMCLTKQFS